MSRSRQQVVRMLALVPYLQSNDGVPVHEVAAEFGVPAKTIRDDLRLLMFTGTGELAGELIDFDLTALEDDGVVHIRDADFLARPLRITASEGAALIVALRTLRASATGDQLPCIDSTLAKLESAVGADTVAAPVDVLVDAVDPDTHRTVVRALTEGRRLAITYATAARDEQTDREVDPRRVFTEQGRLYLEGWCHRAEDLRFFRLDRILDASITEHPAATHDEPVRDLSEGFFTIGDDTPFAVLDLQPRAHWIEEYYQVDVVDDLPDGLRRVKVYGADWDWLRRLVLRNAGSVTVVSPAALADDVTQHASLALRAYDG